MSNTIIKSSIKNFTIGDLKVGGDTTDLESHMNDLMHAILSQNIDIDNINMSSMDLYSVLSDVSDRHRAELDFVNQEINLLVSKEQKIKDLTARVKSFTEVNSKGKPNVFGLHWDIPTLTGVYTITKAASKDILLNSISISQSAFHYSDYFEMKINDTYVIKTMYDKYVYNQRKKLASKYPIKKDDTIELFYHNISGTKRSINIDLEYIDVTEDLFNTVNNTENLEYDIKDI